ncbi:unannotated protein [freshwater metagenome]|uniref:Unannotated protein n=1 Tax=freshwater metagenome TaxID=449393 RepID=A0A6J7QS42_9ZZZZ
MYENERFNPAVLNVNALLAANTTVSCFVARYRSLPVRVAATVTESHEPGLLAAGGVTATGALISCEMLPERMFSIENIQR